MNMKNYVYFKKYAEEKKQTMAVLNVKKGTKMQLALDTKVGQEPQFNMVSTFNKALDESAFLVSIPMLDGKPMDIDESQKILFRYEEGEETRPVAGYVDDVVKEGIRRYWKVRRVTENRQFVKRIDVRMKVELPIEYMQDTWALNSEGETDKEKVLLLKVVGFFVIRIVYLPAVIQQQVC